MTLTTWIDMIHGAMAENGIDTVFRIPNVTWTKETDIIKEWGTSQKVDIDDWEKQLIISGVIQRDGSPVPPCTYDVQNLSWSGKFFLRSISVKLYADVTEEVGVIPSGPKVFRAIINKKQQLNSVNIRQLTNKLLKLNLVHEPAKNVEQFNKKVHSIASKLDKAQHGVDDLSALVAGLYIEALVEAFRLETLTLYNKVTDDHTSMTWKEIQTKLLVKYRQLHGVDKWTPTQATKSLSVDVKALQKKMNKLSQASFNNNNNNNSNRKDDIRCHDCGKPGVKVGHKGCTQPGKQLHKPKKNKKKRW